MKRLVLIFVPFMIGTAVAQDANYWDNQYGTKGGMLGGLVVGSPSDLSATYYNPGWIAMKIDGSFLLTTHAVEASRIKLDDALGTGIDPSSSSVGTSPGYFAGRFNTGRDRTWSWAYSYIHKVKFELDARGRRFDSDPFPPAAGVWISGETLNTAEVNEYWYGLTAARKIKDNIALGISPYVAYRSVTSRMQTSAQAAGVSTELGTFYFADEYSASHLRLLAKIGLAVDLDAWTLGLTVATPSLSIMGSGETVYHTTLSGVDLDGDAAVDPPLVASNYQKDLASSYSSPLSISAGATRRIGRTNFHGTLEWFDAIGHSRAIESAPFRHQTTGEMISTDLYYGSRRVLNWGVGVDHEFDSSLALYAAFRSDFSANPGNDRDNIAVTSWDLWHVSGGASFQFLNIEFNAGAQFTWGSDRALRFIHFNPDGPDEIVGQPGEFDISYQRIKVMIGFNLPMLTPEAEEPGLAR